MDIITRFVNAGWNIKIEHVESSSGFRGVKIFATIRDYKIMADGRNVQEAKKVLRFLNRFEIPSDIRV